MAILIRDSAHHLLLECWAEHHYISNGYKPKLFQHALPINFFKNGGKTFKDVKPIEFDIIDNLIRDFANNPKINPLYGKTALEIIELADNRMIMGDYRYGLITRQDLDAYDTKKEFKRRFDLAFTHESLEYLVDAYNMLRIQYLKDKDKTNATILTKYIMYSYSIHKISHNWSLNSIDDGIHAEKTNN